VAQIFVIAARRELPPPRSDAGNDNDEC